MNDKLTRYQRRAKERINREAEETYRNFTGRYFKLFIESDDPDGETLKEKQKQLNAQWRTYCGSMRLVPEAFDMFDNFCKETIQRYQTEKSSA